MNLRRDQTNDTAPTESADAWDAEQRHVEPVSASLCFGKDLDLFGGEIGVKRSPHSQNKGP